jgi:uncharacterized membrane protein HdeD (DUF308 family)
MLNSLMDHWWLFAIRALAAIAFGILAFAVPGVTLALLIAFFAAFAIVSGIALLGSFWRTRSAAGSSRSSWWVAVMGVVDILAGIVAIAWPGVTALSLLYIVAAWAIVIGAMQIYWAIRLRRAIEGELWTALGGAVSILFGIYLVAVPGAGLLSLVWLVGLWAIVFGVAGLLFAWRLRQMHQGMSLGRA